MAVDTMSTSQSGPLPLTEKGIGMPTDDSRDPRKSYWSAELVFPWQRYLPILLFLSFASGCIDVFSVPALRVFVANNTGNIIFLCLAAGQMHSVDPTSIYPVAAIVALAGSWIGSYISGIAGRRFGKKTRIYLFVDFLVQSLVVFLVCGLYWGNVVVLHDGRTEYVAVALLALSMGSQNVTVKTGISGPPTMPTQVATGAMADLFSDPKLFVGFSKNRPRNERVIFIATFVLGGIVGAFAYRYSHYTTCLVLTAIFKLFAALSLLVWGKEAPRRA